MRDHPVLVCTCEQGPYLGAQKWGTPTSCERCGFIIQEQLDAIERKAQGKVLREFAQHDLVNVVPFCDIANDWFHTGREWTQEEAMRWADRIDPDNAKEDE